MLRVRQRYYMVLLFRSKAGWRICDNRVLYGMVIYTWDRLSKRFFCREIFILQALRFKVNILFSA